MIRNVYVVNKVAISTSCFVRLISEKERFFSWNVALLFSQFRYAMGDAK